MAYMGAFFTPLMAKQFLEALGAPDAARGAFCSSYRASGEAHAYAEAFMADGVAALSDAAQPSPLQRHELALDGERRLPREEDDVVVDAGAAQRLPRLVDVGDLAVRVGGPPRRAVEEAELLVLVDVSFDRKAVNVRLVLRAAAR